LVTGPYRWATTTRAFTATAARRVGVLVSAAFGRVATGAEGGATVAWVRRHIDLLRAAGVVVAVLLLLTLSLNVWGTLIVLALLAIFELGLHRLRPRQGVNLPPPPPASA
jgi:hypothetical protein